MMHPKRLAEIKQRFNRIADFPYGVRLTDVDQVFLVVAMNDLVHEVDELNRRIDTIIRVTET